MNNREEKINALLLDNRFVDWVVNPHSPYTEYWLQWIAASNENADLAEEAKIFLLQLRNTENEISIEINDAVIEQMLLDIKESISQSPLPVVIKTNSIQRWYWLAAAVAGIMVFLGNAFFRQPEQKPVQTEIVKDKQPSPEVVRYNGNENNELIFLPDGSKVTLAKRSRISYSRLMNGKTRTLSLTGEAFFDISKIPEKPFYIYTQNMVIKVLGTSFRVIASAGKESVAVKSGKVSVYLKGQDLEQSAAKILMAKQVCTYSLAAKELITTDYTSHLKIQIEAENMQAYNFEDAPLDTVFKTLEKMYSLPIYYNRDVFEDCFVTISLENESLEEKLEVITKTIGASFSISDYGISIQGKGCK